MLEKFYLTTSACVLLLYGVATFAGWELGTPERETEQAAKTRHATGGRSRSVWFFSSYRGGK